METTTNPKPVEPGGSLFGHLLSSLSAMFVLVVICCGVYPLLVWAVAQGVFPNQANGSLLTRDGKPTTKDDDAVGSALLGQPFLLPGYFHPRPSAAGNSAGTPAAPTSFSPAGGYDPTSSGGTNYGPLNDGLLNGATVTPATQPAPTTAPTPNIRWTSPSPMATRRKPSVPRMRVTHGTSPPTSAPRAAPRKPLAALVAAVARIAMPPFVTVADTFA